MSTVMSARTVRANEHRYFLAAAVVVAFLVLWAFGFEYRDLMHPSQFTVLVQVHGLVMFAWVGLFLTQVALIVADVGAGALAGTTVWAGIARTLIA